MKRVNAADSKQLQDQGWQYLDVRTEKEFEAGHPAGAVNVPFNAPNFLEQVAAKFTDKAAKLIVGCQVGGRSMRASALLEQQGYTNLVDNGGGYEEWSAKKLPSAMGKS
ncbi:MAG: rhodanese-like domain-containing protein [Archangiaceae bacterium]|nr:rhodanese-like domain-containing protein [Archangiaceae bacterium]